MKKIIIFHSVLLALIIGALSFAYARYWNIAVANGKAISRLDYIRLLEKQGGEQVLAQMIDDTLVLKEGESKGVKIEDKVISDEITKIETRLKAQNQTLDAALSANKMTRADLELQIKISKTEEALSAPKTEITQAQIDDFLKTNKALLPTGKSKDELNALAKSQLISDANKAAATTWLDALRKSAKIEYK